MNETDTPQGRGIRGLWDKISGNAAKQARLTEEQRIRREESLDLAQLVKNQIQQAIEIDTLIAQKLELEGYPLPNLDMKHEVSRIAESIKAWEVYGKFPYGGTVRGYTIKHPSGGEFSSYGDVDRIGYPNNKSAAIYLLGTINALIHPSGFNTKFLTQQRIGRNFLLYVNADSEDMIVTYNLPSSFYDSSSVRPAHRASVFFLLPKEEVYKFLSLIRRDPEVTETFLQEAAPGIDGDPVPKKPGLDRIKAEETILVNLSRFNRDNLNPCIDTQTYQLFVNLREALGLEYVRGPLTPKNVFQASCGENGYRQFRKIDAEMEENSNGQIERVKYGKLP